VAVITKLHLVAAESFAMTAACRNIQAVRPGMRMFPLSAKTGEGMGSYFGLLAQRNAQSRQAAAG